MTDFKLVYGANEVTFYGKPTAGAKWVVRGNYSPAAPEDKGSDTDNSLESGGEHPTRVWRNVDETIDLIYMGTSANFKTDKAVLERFLEAASQAQKNLAAPKVYFHVKNGLDSEWWRSEILVGKIAYPQGFLDYPYPNGLLALSIAFRRRYYFEALVLRTIHLYTNLAPTPATSVTLYAHRDTTHTNVAYFNADQVEGEIDAPAYVTMTNKQNDFWGNLYYLGCSYGDNVAGLPYNLQAEAADSGMAIITSSAYSGGQARQGLVYGTTPLAVWTLTNTAWLSAAQGKYYRVLAWLNNTDPNNVFYMNIKKYVTELWKGSEIARSSTNLHDLGVVQLPPYLPGNSGYDDIIFSIYGSNTVNPGSQATLDFVVFVPTESYVLIDQRGYRTYIGDKIVVDTPLQTAYAENVGHGKWMLFTRYGDGIFLKPKEKHSLVFSLCSAMNEVVGPSFDIGLTYYPRRLTVV